ncbi:hypothetical protein CSUI_008812 [Cystoisospora suis]|uniref:Uncharacterized protein n=1 Tax=Cystoisospora suis TaxID=483139 RepID=A0A2C6KLV9_9APIC|nr:hypothetical protein CSUI_008812 [Cystoisospora suis]
MRSVLEEERRHCKLPTVSVSDSMEMASLSQKANNVVLGSISDQDGLSERLRKPGHLLRCSIDRVVFSVQEPKAVSVEGLRVLSRVSSKVRRQADALARIVDQFLKRSAEESHQRSLPATAMKPAGSLAFNRLCKFLFGEKQTGLRGTPWPIANPSESLAID